MRGYDLNPAGLLLVLREGRADDVESIRADVRDVEAEDLCGFDAVIHPAAVCNDPVGDRSPDSTRVTVSIRYGWYPPIKKAR